MQTIIVNMSRAGERRSSNRRGNIGTSDKVLSTDMGNNGGDLVAAAAERGRSRTRRVTVSKAKVTGSEPTNSGSKAEPNVINVMLQELSELTSGSETVNDSAVISEQTHEQRAGAVDGTGAAAAVTRPV